jgi:halocyanin-like protein
MFESTHTRRSIVLSTGTLALTALAGCSGSGSTDTESGGSDGGSGSTDTESGGGTAGCDGWLSNVGNYDGGVGASGNGGNFAFDPAAVRVSTGTTVVWEWTGQGAQHNVAADGGGFESGMSAEEGYTFEHTFSEAGTYEYVCTPHRTLGMKGVVVVE